MASHIRLASQAGFLQASLSKFYITGVTSGDKIYTENITPPNPYVTVYTVQVGFNKEGTLTFLMSNGIDEVPMSVQNVSDTNPNAGNSYTWIVEEGYTWNMKFDTSDGSTYTINSITVLAHPGIY